MNSRQRVLAAINHQEPDRVPLDLGTTDTFIAREVYEGMAAILGIEPTAAKGVGHPGAFVTPDEKMLQILGADIRLVGTAGRPDVEGPWGPAPREEILPDGTKQWTHRDGAIRRLPAGESDVQLYRSAIQGEFSAEEIDRVLPPSPLPRDWVDPAPMREAAAKHHQNGLSVQACFIIMPVTGTSCGPLDFTRWCMELALQPELLCRLMDRSMEHMFAGGESFYSAIGQDMDVVYGVGDDVAMHANMWMSPADYRKYVKPRHAQIVQYIKKRTKAKIIHHCCGACSDIIGDLIEIGVDIFNPTQTSAAGMDPFELKKRFGKDITFWGGMDVIHLLPKGTAADVEREVKRHIDALAPGGGYVFSPSHIIQRFTPPENALTMYRVAAEYGKY